MGVLQIIVIATATLLFLYGFIWAVSALILFMYFKRRTTFLRSFDNNKREKD